MSKNRMNLEFPNSEGKEKLIVEVTQPRGLKLPAYDGLTDPDEAEGKMLLPGQNNVSQELWDKAKTNPGVVIALKSQLLKLKGKGEAVPLIDGWDQLTVAKVTALLEKVDDIEEVNKIKSAAKRKGIKQACTRRINAIMDEIE